MVSNRMGLVVRGLFRIFQYSPQRIVFCVVAVLSMVMAGSILVTPSRDGTAVATDFVPPGVAAKQMKSGDDGKTMAELDAKLKRNPRDVQALLARARIHANPKFTPNHAIKDLKRVIELEPNCIEAYLLYSQLDGRVAVELLTKGIQRHPANIELYSARAHAQLENNKLELADKDFAAVDKMTAGGSLEAIVFRARIRADLKQPTEAVEYCDQAIQRDPSYAPAYFWKGQILESKGNASEAKACYESALKAQANYLIAAQALKRLNRRFEDQAWRSLNEQLALPATNLFPDDSIQRAGRRHEEQLRRRLGPLGR